MGKKVYAVHTRMGLGIRTYDEDKDLFNQACYDVGRENVERVEEASKDDIAWVKAMGGYLPPEAKHEGSP